MRQRPSARLLVLDPENCVLLFRFVFDDGALAGQAFWATPGGALEEGESFAAAAVRELLEETGIAASVGEQVLQRDAVFDLPKGESVTADERYFLVRVGAVEVDASRRDRLEASVIAAHKWWTAVELATTSETVYPEGLAELLDSLAPAED